MSAQLPHNETNLAPGDRVDRYQLLSQLGHGGMAEVWLARLPSRFGVSSLVAFKTLRRDISSEPTLATMLIDEARICSRIRHPNVAEVLEVGEHHGVPFLVMEFVDGEPLEALVTELRSHGENIEPRLALRLIADVCAGLHAAHETCSEDGSPAEVVHRDVSPNNIMIDRFGQVKVVDFGVAKARERFAETTTSGQAKGTLRYMPREQALGRSVDRRSDIWATGAVLYYLLTGAHPFGDESTFAALRAVMNGEAPQPLPERIPPVVREVVARALRHDPNERYATALEMHSALTGALTQLGGADREDLAKLARERLTDRFTAREQLLSTARHMPEAESPQIAPVRVGTPVTLVSPPQPTSSAPPQSVPSVPTPPSDSVPPPVSSRRKLIGWIGLGLGIAAVAAVAAFASYSRNDVTAESREPADSMGTPEYPSPPSGPTGVSAAAASSTLPDIGPPPSTDRVAKDRPAPAQSSPPTPTLPTPTQSTPTPPITTPLPTWQKDYGF